VRALGSALGTVHALAPLDAEPPRFTYDVGSLLTTPMQTAAAALRHRPEDLDWCRRLVDELTGALDALPDLTQGTIHGDLQLKNANADGDDVVLFDFDEAGAGWVAHDLALFRYATRFAGHAPELTDALVDGYDDVVPLSDADRAAIPLLDIAVQFHVLDWWTRLARDRGPLVWLETFVDRWLAGMRSSERTAQLSRPGR
jgi:homoserine kinase type II